jgi:hypothetical protein
MALLDTLDTTLGINMELYIQPNITTFPTASVLTGDEIRSLFWLGFTSETTVEQITTAGYISVPETGIAQPANTTLVVDKNNSGQFSAVWMSDVEYKQALGEQLSVGVARARRNLLLQQSDWTQGKDIPDAVSSVWTAYRQALRDITTQEGFPNVIQWPQQPV